MKKIFYILASAIVALGAVACQNEVDENINPNDTKEITFNVSFDESTRIAGDITNGTATFEFEGDEILKVGEAELTQESAGVFTADAENSAILNDLVGDTVTATVSDEGNGLKFASEEITLIAGENNITLSLACPALYFIVPANTANVNLTIGEETIWFDKTPEVKDFFRGLEGTEVYIKHAIGEEVVKETTLRNLTNKVYNLGTLDTDMTIANVAALIEKAEPGSTVTLPAGATITGSEILTIDKDITIDGNGATLSSTAERAINVSGEGVEATIENLTVVCSGERGVNVIQNAQSVTLTDVNITAANYAVNVASSAAGAVVVINGGEYNGLNVVNVGGTATVTIDNATINCNDNNSSESYSAIAINSNAENATITATNCTFNISGDSHIASNSGTNCSITLSPEGEVVENVAAINYGDYAYVFSTLAEAIEYANEKDNSATIVLLRDAEIAQVGTFKIDLNGCTLTAADGYNLTIDEENNTVTVVTWITVANLATMIDNAEEGSTITLPAGATITGGEILLINKAITIDGNGATFSSTAARAINIETTGVVNISNLTINCTQERVFNIINQPATVNISDVTATATNYAIMVATSAGAATVNVENSTLTGLNVVNVAGAGAQVTVTDCTLNCNDNSAAESYAALALNHTAEGGSITATGCTINVNGDSSAAWNSTETGTIIINNNNAGVEAVAYISYENGYSYSFDNLEEAIEYAKEGDTIVLIRDAEIAQVGTFKIDVNGHTLTAGDGYVAVKDWSKKDYYDVMAATASDYYVCGWIAGKDTWANGGYQMYQTSDNEFYAFNVALTAVNDYFKLRNNTAANDTDKYLGCWNGHTDSLYDLAANEGYGPNYFNSGEHDGQFRAKTTGTYHVKFTRSDANYGGAGTITLIPVAK